MKHPAGRKFLAARAFEATRCDPLLALDLVLDLIRDGIVIADRAGVHYAPETARRIAA